MKIKKIYFIGAGPGKVDLLTVRGKKILQEAETIIYDYLVNPAILELAKENTELINAHRIDNSVKKNINHAHKELGKLIVKKAKQGKKVVRLKNGTPGIFGRLLQELEPLEKNNINYEIVPGITASNAASCYTGVPLTDRQFASSCVLVTGKEDPNKKKSLIDWQALTKAGTIVLYMAVGSLDKIVNNLIKEDKPKDTPVCLVKDASCITQKTVNGTLENIEERAKDEQVKPPAIVIIGKVAKLEEKFNWLKKTKKVLYTGLSKERFYLNKIFFHLPLIKIVPMNDYTEFDNYLREIYKFDWIVFTSRYGVKYFFKRLEAIKKDIRELKDIKIAAIGNSTKNRLSRYRINVDLIPENESSQGLIEEFKKRDLKGENIFLPRSNISDKGLEKKFKELGVKTITSFAYRNIQPENLPDLDLKFFDEILFSSPSTVRNFKKQYKKVPSGVKIKCIGDVTENEAKKCNLID